MDPDAPSAEVGGAAADRGVGSAPSSDVPLDGEDECSLSLALGRGTRLATLIVETYDWDTYSREHSAAPPVAEFVEALAATIGAARNVIQYLLSCLRTGDGATTVSMPWWVSSGITPDAIADAVDTFRRAFVWLHVPSPDARVRYADKAISMLCQRGARVFWEDFTQDVHVTASDAYTPMGIPDALWLVILHLTLLGDLYTGDSAGTTLSMYATLSSQRVLPSRALTPWDAPCGQWTAKQFMGAFLALVGAWKSVRYTPLLAQYLDALSCVAARLTVLPWPAAVWNVPILARRLSIAASAVPLYAPQIAWISWVCDAFRDMYRDIEGVTWALNAAVPLRPGAGDAAGAASAVVAPWSIAVDGLLQTLAARSCDETFVTRYETALAECFIRPGDATFAAVPGTGFVNWGTVLQRIAGHLQTPLADAMEAAGVPITGMASGASALRGQPLLLFTRPKLLCLVRNVATSPVGAVLLGGGRAPITPPNYGAILEMGRLSADADARVAGDLASRGKVQGSGAAPAATAAERRRAAAARKDAVARAVEATAPLPSIDAILPGFPRAFEALQFMPSGDGRRKEAVAEDVGMPECTVTDVAALQTMWQDAVPNPVGLGRVQYDYVVAGMLDSHFMSEAGGMGAIHADDLWSTNFVWHTDLVISAYRQLARWCDAREDVTHDARILVLMGHYFVLGVPGLTPGLTAHSSLRDAIGHWCALTAGPGLACINGRTCPTLVRMRDAGLHPPDATGVLPPPKIAPEDIFREVDLTDRPSAALVGVCGVADAATVRRGDRAELGRDVRVVGAAAAAAAAADGGGGGGGAAAT